MAETTTAGFVSDENNNTGACESVCIHTKKIFSSCKDKDCIEDLRFYPTESAQEVLAGAQSVRGGRAELLYTFVDVEPVNFNRGYFTVDMRFYYRVILRAMNGSTRHTEVEGLATFDKRVILFGGENGAKIFYSEPVDDERERRLDLTSNLPTAVVEVVDPLLLCARFVDGGNCDCGALGGVPKGILAAFDEKLILDECKSRRICVSLGQFSMVRLERDTQLLIPFLEYCVPTDECVVAGSGSNDSCEDPCTIFEDVEFPLDSFFPSSTADDGSDGCGCDR